MSFRLRFAGRRHVSVAAASLVFFALLAAGAGAVSTLRAPSPVVLRQGVLHTLQTVMHDAGARHS